MKKTEEELIDEISSASSKSLAARVVIYRTLGMNKRLAAACMAELASRRKAGEDFDYELFIDEEVKKIPISASLDISKYTQSIKNHVRSFDVSKVVQAYNSKNNS